MTVGDTLPYPRKPSDGYACLVRKQISYQYYSIRAVEVSDIELIRQWRNAQMDVLRQQREIIPAEQLAYYEQHIWPTLGDVRPENILLAYSLGDRLIGYGGLVHIAWEHRRAELSFLLDPARGINEHSYRCDFSAFLQLIKSLAFEDLNLQRIYTETYAHRTHHISVIEATGFSHEGTLRENILLNGQPVDSLIHSCLKKEYI